MFFENLRNSVISLLLVFLVSLPNWAVAANTVHFQTNVPGLFDRTGVLQVALPIVNVGDAKAISVKVTSATLASASAQSISTPSLGDVASNQQVIFEAKFVSGALKQNVRYLLSVKGTYKLAGSTVGFAVNRQLILPAPADGDRPLTVVPINPVKTLCVSAPCVPLSGGGIVFEEAEVNMSGPPIPTGAVNPPIPSFMTQQPSPAPPAPGLGGSGGIFFTQTTTAPNPTSLFSGIPPDMSGASSTTCSGDLALICTNLVVMTGNTFLSYSTDSGATFPNAQIRRANNVYSDTPDGGFCCDQVVQYVPSINRYVWLIQTRRATTTAGANTGPNRLRIALASPQTLISTGALAWTFYDLTSATFGIGNNWLDYPDMAVGNNFLYISVDQVGTGLIVARLPLGDIAAGRNTTVEFTNASDGATAYGGHLSQNALDGVYWAGHNSSSNIRVFRMPEGNNRYFWQSLNVNSWANGNFVTNAPDGLDWLSFGFPRQSVMGAARRAGPNDLWLAWGAGRDGNFPQPHVELARFTRNADGSVSFGNQMQIWNASLAFQYPSLATDNGDHLAVALGWGGGSSNTYGSFAVGFWGDFVVYYINQSNLTAAYDLFDTSTPPRLTGNQPRWGDYVTVRPAGGPNNPFQFSGFGYAVRTDPTNRDGCKTVSTVVTGCRFEPHYIRFEFLNNSPG